MRKKRKKIRIKWNNVLLLFIITIIFILILSNVNKSPNIKEDETSNNKNNTTEQEKLEKLDNINEQIDYFNIKYLNRYILYKELNPNMEITQIIKNVNMNLDQEHYEYKIPAKTEENELILVNKYYYLEEDYVPENLQTIKITYALSNMRLVENAKNSFEELAKAAKKEELNIVAMSTYRSYSYQVNLYNKYVKKDGIDAADTYSGRPGHSEHQTGLAVDVYNKKEEYTNFEKTEEYKWMQKHAHEYGFILRFPKDKEIETGYKFEAWHYRYVGIEAATYIHENNISLEEYHATILKDW